MIVVLIFAGVRIIFILDFVRIVIVVLISTSVRALSGIEELPLTASDRHSAQTPLPTENA